jgi:four helix bundle protein
MDLPRGGLLLRGMSYEKLKVYQVAMALRAEVDRLREGMDPEFVLAYEHLDDAVNSIGNNIAEGASSTYPGRQKSFYDIAGGSAGEARNCLTSFAKRGAFPGMSVHRAVTFCVLAKKMLNAMIAERARIIAEEKAKRNERRTVGVPKSEQTPEKAINQRRKTP